MRKLCVWAVAVLFVLGVSAGVQAKKQTDKDSTTKASDVDPKTKDDKSKGKDTDKKEKGKEKQEKEHNYSGENKIYSSSEYRFELKYPGDWNYSENKPGGEANLPTNIPGLKINTSSMMPHMLSVCFSGKKKCDMGGFDDKDPAAQLMIMNIKPSEKATAKKGKEVEKTGKEHVEKPECEVIERNQVKWGGASAPWMTMRCPEKKKWRYTTTVTMMRPSGKTKDMYTMMCSMRSDSKDREESFGEYKSELKPRCQEMVSSTKFRK